ncbi:hypothetical protein BHM03_00017293 [Ensete ventricosum]|nr:hypothetical protein BHM03_00017293 [Ensete ventricosum]
MLLATSLGVPEIKKVNSQESHNGGVLVHVTGRLTREDNVRRDFSQSFFLAPQEMGYFVLNDILQYVDEIEEHQGSANVRFVGLSGRNWSVEQEETVSLPSDVVVAPAKEICDSVSNDESSAVKEKEPGNEVCDSVSNDESSTVQGKEPSIDVSDSVNNGESSTVQEKEPSTDVSDSMNNGESSTVQEKELDNDVSNVASDSCHQQMPKMTYASVLINTEEDFHLAEWVGSRVAQGSMVTEAMLEAGLGTGLDTGPGSHRKLN